VHENDNNIGYLTEAAPALAASPENIYDKNTGMDLKKCFVFVKENYPF
jgi:hypothetical protein